MHMNLHLLRVFHAVASQRSFSRAAESLFISQPAVSKAVRELERQLELPLVERGAGGTRGARGARLTDGGQALFEYARGIFAMERAAIEDVRDRVGRRRGRLAVGASTTVGAYWLAPYVAELLRLHPAIDLQVVTGNTEFVRQALVECRVEVALVEGAVSDPRISAERWRDDELRIVARPGTAFSRARAPTLRELNGQNWLLREPGSGTRGVTERLLAEMGVQPQRVLELGSNEAIARAVAAGVGVALLPVRSVRELVRLRELEALRAPKAARLVRSLYQLRLRDRAPSPLSRAWCEILQRPLETR